jgi:GDP-L-fucose synthase
MALDAPIYVAGHRGMVGSALMRELKKQGYQHLMTRSREELDLTDQSRVREFFASNRPAYVFLAAAKVGGIYANNVYRAEFIQQNLAIQNNVIDAAYRAGVERLIFLGSSCIYPRDCPQPIREEYLLSGPLEMSNRPYAVAKIAGVEQCWGYNRQYGTHYLAVMPTNLYGPGDSYHPENSHVIPSLIKKAHQAKIRGDASMVVWGSGRPLREFMYSDDMASACVHLMNLDAQRFASLLHTDMPPLVNVGVGYDMSIRALAHIICHVVGYQGALVFDTERPDGSPRKLLDVERLNSLGWQARTGLGQGLAQAYRDYLSHAAVEQLARVAACAD